MFACAGPKCSAGKFLEILAVHVGWSDNSMFNMYVPEIIFHDYNYGFSHKQNCVQVEVSF